MTMQRSWRVLWRKTKTRPPSQYQRRERESEASFIRFIFRGPHLYKDWLGELLRVLQVHFHHNFFLLQRRRFGSIYTACGRLREERIDYCHFSEAYGSPKLELGVGRIFMLSFSYRQVLAENSRGRLPLVWLTDGLRR